MRHTLFIRSLDLLHQYRDLVILAILVAAVGIVLGVWTADDIKLVAVSAFNYLFADGAP